MWGDVGNIRNTTKIAIQGTRSFMCLYVSCNELIAIFSFLIIEKYIIFC